MMHKPVEKIAIIGGGFTGAVTAIHLSRAATRPLDISIIEPREELGRGVAYGTTDPNHRLNAPTFGHILFPDEPAHFDTWMRESGTLERDPEALAPDDRVYVRRAEFGRYVGAMLQDHVETNPSSTKIRHVRDRVVAADVADDGAEFRITLGGGGTLLADLVVLTTSNEKPPPPPPFPADAGDHPVYVANPWAPGALDGIADDARILIIGTGLTTADVVTSLLARNHRGAIRAVSRRGLTASRQRRNWEGQIPITERLAQPVPQFVQDHGTPSTVRAVVRALREDIARIEALGCSGSGSDSTGRTWHDAFDNLRTAVHLIWPQLPLAEKRRFMRHLRPWYEVHRFRLPPQLEPVLDAAAASGQLVMERARLASVDMAVDEITVGLLRPGHPEVDRAPYDAVIDCTGLEVQPGRSTNPVLQSLLRHGLARAHPCGMGLDVDGDCRAVSDNGAANSRLFVLGPLTRGAFGEATAVFQITYQVARVVPIMLGGTAPIAHT